MIYMCLLDEGTKLNVKCNMLINQQWPFSIRLKNDRKDLKRIDAISGIRHFSQTGPNFKLEAKFSITEQISNLNKGKEEKRKIGEHREDFWILKLKTSQPYGLNDKLNHPQDVAGLIF